MAIVGLVPRLRDRIECMRVKPLLQAYLDGELDRQSTGLVGRHLEACRRCGLAADAYRELHEALRASAPDPDPAVVRRLQAFVEELAGDDGAQRDDQGR